jgi:site-specific DNA-cytosine methylase
MSTLNYNIFYTTIKASDIGFCHPRNRIFILCIKNNIKVNIPKSNKQICTYDEKKDYWHSKQKNLFTNEYANYGARFPFVACVIDKKLYKIKSFKEKDKLTQKKVPFLKTPIKKERIKNKQSKYDGFEQLTDQLTNVFLRTPTASETKAGSNSDPKTLREQNRTVKLSNQVKHLPFLNQLKENKNYEQYISNINKSYKNKFGVFAPVVKKQEQITGLIAPIPIMINKNTNKPVLNGDFACWMFGIDPKFLSDVKDIYK